MKQKHETVSGHTPGPWGSSGCTIRHGETIIARTVSDYFEELYTGSMLEDDAGSYLDHEGNERTASANARLIAQAPTLLAQRDRLAAALRGMMGLTVVSAEQVASARALLAEIDGEAARG